MRTLSNDGKLLTAGIFFTLIAATFISVAMFAFADTDVFSVAATVANDPPTIVVDAGQSVLGSASTSAVVHVYFNASDPNLAGDLNDSTASVTLSRASNTDRTSSSCTASAIDSTTRRYDCSVTIWYYDEAATDGWLINASIEDNSSNAVFNDSVMMSFGDIDSVTIVQASISFPSSAPGTANVAASETQQLNNTGNWDYTSINVTGYNLEKGADIIGASNASVDSDSGEPGSATLSHGTPIVMPSGALARGENSLEDAYFWLDIPAAQPSGVYNSGTNWIFEAIQ